METTEKPHPRPNPDFYYDTAALVALLGLLVTGLALWPLLGFGPAAPKYFWSLHRQQWINLHLAFALVFGVICIIHLVRHWRWIKLMTPRHLGPGQGLRAIARFLSAILLTGAAVWSSYALFQYRLVAVERRSSSIMGRDAVIPENGKGMSRTQGQGRGPRWRGGRSGQESF